MASFTITAAAGKFTADHTAFICGFDLTNASVPSEFWSDVDADGGNIRVRDGSLTRVPVDPVHFDKANERGWIAFRSDVATASDNEFTVDTDGSAFSPASPVALPITNGDAETGDTTGWTDDINTMAVKDVNPAPAEGNWYFYGGSTAETRAHQDVSIPSAAHSAIDAGERHLFVEFMRSSFSGDDNGGLEVEFYDGSMVKLGDTQYTGVDHPVPAQDWYDEDWLMPIPAGARTVRIYLQFDRESGTANNGHIDDIRAEVVELDPYGMYAVWQDYDGVCMLGDGLGTVTQRAPTMLTPRRVRKTMGFDLSNLGELHTFPAGRTHQGVCFDGTYYYIIGDDGLFKYTKSGSTWTVVDSVGESALFASITGRNITHVGDPCIGPSGNLWAGAVSGGDAKSYLCEFDVSDLSFVQAYEITATNGTSAASAAYNPDDGLIYVARYDNGVGAYGYDPADGSNDNDIIFDSAFGTNTVQGITFGRGRMFVMHSGIAPGVYEVKLDGTRLGRHFEVGGTQEGLDWVEDDDGAATLLAAVHSTPGEIRFYKLVQDIAAGGGGGTKMADRIVLPFRSDPNRDTFSFGVTAGLNGSGGAALLTLAPSGGTFSVRVGVAIDGSDQLQIWEPAQNGSESSTTVIASWPATTRVGVTYLDTTRRRLYADGVEVLEDTTLSDAKGGFNGTHDYSPFMVFGDYQEEGFSLFPGGLAFGFVREGELAAEWWADEADMLADNAAFWSVSDTTPYPDRPTVHIVSFNKTGVSATTGAFSGSSTGTAHISTDWRLTRISDAVVVATINSTSNLTSITNAGSTVPLDTDTNLYSIEARHEEST